MKAALEVLDLRVEPSSEVLGKSARYTATRSSDGPTVLWSGTRAPRGWSRVGDGVAYLASSAGWNKVTAQVKAGTLQSIEYFDNAHSGGKALIVLLPAGYTLKSLDNVTPLPTRVKEHKGRLAILWDLDKDQSNVVFQMNKGPLSVETLDSGLIARPHAQDVLVDPDAPLPPAPPTSPTEWLLEAVRRVPLLVYAIAVVGLVAAAAISIGFMLGDPTYAILGAIAVLVGMILVRLYVALQPEELRVNVSWPVQVMIWACAIAFVVLVGAGTVKMTVVLFTPKEVTPSVSSREREETNKVNDDKISAVDTAAKTRVPENEEGVDLDGMWVSKGLNLDGRFLLEIKQESCRLIERDKGNKLTFETRIKRENGYIYIGRPNNQEVLAFKFRPALVEAALKMNPPDSFLRLRREGKKLVGSWNGLQLKTYGTDQINELGIIQVKCEFEKR